MTRYEPKTTGILGVEGWRNAAVVFLYYEDGPTRIYTLGEEPHWVFPGDVAKDRAADPELVSQIREFVRRYESLTEIRALVEGDTIHLSLVWVDGRVDKPFPYTGAFDVRWLGD